MFVVYEGGYAILINVSNRTIIITVSSCTYKCVASSLFKVVNMAMSSILSMRKGLSINGKRVFLYL